MTQEILQIRSNGQITLPPELRRKAHLAEGDFLEASLAEDGTVCLKPQMVIDRDQAWFWTSRWQAGETAADADIKAGRVAGFDTIDDLFKDLEDGK